MFDDFYGLTGRPFQLTPDPNFYFESITHRKALSYLGYGMAQSEGFIVITGEIGSGKSTLVAHLIQKIDRNQMTVGQVVTSNLDGEELVHIAAQSFGLEVEGHDKATALGAIENFLHEEARDGRRTLLVVDESQNLSVEALEELRMLSNFQLGAHPLLQLLLLGQPEFKTMLSEHDGLEQLRQRVIAAHHLDAMEPGEMEPYIKHRLECVGWSGNPDFDQRVFAELYEVTGGIPRRVNQMVTRLLLLGAVEQRTRIDNTMLTAVLKDMSSDNAFPEAPPQPLQKQTLAPVEDEREEIAVDQGIDIASLLAERDAQTADLQAVVAELSRKIEEVGTAEKQAAADQTADVVTLLEERDAQTADLQSVVGELSRKIEEVDTAEKQAAAARAADVASLLEERDAQTADLQAVVAELSRKIEEAETAEEQAAAAHKADMASLLEQRDAQTAELQAAIVELSRKIEETDCSTLVMETVEGQVAIKERLDEQERMMRHMLTMLVEWVESGNSIRAVA